MITAQNYILATHSKANFWNTHFPNHHFPWEQPSMTKAPHNPKFNPKNCDNAYVYIVFDYMDSSFIISLPPIKL